MMVAAIYLDPRVKFKWNETQKECAMFYLKQLTIRHQQIESNDEMHTENEADLVNDTLDELNEEFYSAQVHVSYEDSSLYDSNQLMIAITEYDKVKHVDVKSTAKNFWKIH